MRPAHRRRVFILGHLGIGLGLAWLLAWRSPTRIDYRLVLFGALLPDLIDKPLGYALGLQTRLWAHTLLFLVAILALSLVPRWRGLGLVGFGVATHLLLDEIWDLPNVFWYPAYGWTFPAVPFSADVWFQSLLHDPYIQFGEIAGTILLLAFAWVHGIRSWKTFWDFVRRGILPRSATQTPA